MVPRHLLVNIEKDPFLFFLSCTCDLIFSEIMR